MAFPFPIESWIKATMQDLDNSQTCAKVARDWVDDFYYVIEPGGLLEKPVTLYMDLWHGKCRDAFALDELDGRQPAYLLSAPVANWKKVMPKKLDPIQAMMTGQLRLKGDMARIVRAVPAAKELVESSTRIPTEFPLQERFCLPVYPVGWFLLKVERRIYGEARLSGNIYTVKKGTAGV